LALVDSLLGAIIKPDGDTLVLHVGERPYVVTPLGPIELSSRPLTVDAMDNMLDQLLPASSRRTLDELGAVEYDLQSPEEGKGERFTMVAARDGIDIWVEIRRHRAAGQEPEAPAAETGREAMEGSARPQEPAMRDAAADAIPAIVVPLSRSPIGSEPSRQRPPSSRLSRLDRLLRLAAARGASALYITTQSAPSVRVDGEIGVLEGEPTLDASEVESLLLEMAPERSRQALQSGVGTEWLCDLPDVGRVRCMSFHDHRGPGGIFRLIPSRAISAEQLGLSREILRLCAQPGGLVLVAGPRSSGKSTLVSAFVDQINRERSEHVITLESEIKFVQENRRSLISQREVRGDNQEWIAVARAALRENPDVLVIEDLRSPELVSLAIDAAESGRLVIAAMTASAAAAAIVRLLDPFPAERRGQMQRTLADVLRGVVAQVLLRKAGGGRVAARELLLNTPAVAGLIAEGKLQQIPVALESGRRHGMVPLNDALVAFVQSGAVDAREAWRKAFDRQGFLDLLKREGIDTSFVERLA
jgi:twitching motility protein PilT